MRIGSKWLPDLKGLRWIHTQKHSEIYTYSNVVNNILKCQPCIKHHNHFLLHRYSKTRNWKICIHALYPTCIKDNIKFICEPFLCIKTCKFMLFSQEKSNNKWVKCAIFKLCKIVIYLPKTLEYHNVIFWNVWKENLLRFLKGNQSYFSKLSLSFIWRIITLNNLQFRLKWSSLLDVQSNLVNCSCLYFTV